MKLALSAMSVAGNLQVLAGGDDEDPHRRTFRRDLAIGGCVAARVDVDAQEGHPVGDPGAHHLGVLPDPAGEGERVEATGGDRHGGDPVAADVEGEAGARVVACGDLLQVGGTGEGGQAAPVLQGLGDLVGFEVLALGEPELEPGIDAAGAGGYDQGLRAG
ncbi:hypothetical protein GCM10009836_72930 [Pseudonocardia ailaonensis]|uniref:Uncharacterized protein n=1 Tax=Pseudonocardia ailaonensis TaxID=367279 RepID=A0ABN2NRT0_9PSEU